MTDLPFVILDTETTGLSPKTDRVVEVAWIEIDNDFEIVDRDMSLIDPEKPIPPHLSAVHGITDRMVAGAPTLRDYFEVLMNDAFAQRPICLCCHNSQFDYGFIEPYLHPDTIQLCTLKLARRLYPNAENHKLGTLAYMFDLIDSSTRLHSAEGDLSVMVGLLKQMCHDANTDLAGLLTLANEPQVITHIGFGKHRGTALKDLPANYINWLLTKADNLDADLRAAIEAL